MHMRLKSQQSKMAKFKHHGQRKRADIIPVLGKPGYFLHRLRRRDGKRHVKHVRSKPADLDRSPFLVDFCIRRKRRGRQGGWGAPLSLFPVKDRYGRWDLKVKLGGVGEYYHRVVALSVNPCTTGSLGREIDPFWIATGTAGSYEVHHGTQGTHDCRVENLFVLHWKHHRSLKKKDM